ncbi:hypothetical protein, partial [Desulfogranum marinum]|uniref:hypothetical protein n=1 Tax=Desulfogranum marinum TaxID=453220 RepID=UPI0019669C48
MYLSKRYACFFILVLAVGLSIYRNVFHVPFLFDDARNIQHPELRINEFSKDTIVNALIGGELGERPVSNLSFGLRESRINGLFPSVFNYAINMEIRVNSTFKFSCFWGCSEQLNRP